MPSNTLQVNMEVTFIKYFSFHTRFERTQFSVKIRLLIEVCYSSVQNMS